MPMKKGPENETPAQKFERVGGARVSNVIQLLATLASMGGEVPSAEFVEQAFGPMQAALDDAKSKWAGRVSTGRARVFAFRAPDARQAEIPHTAPQQKAASSAKR